MLPVQVRVLWSSSCTLAQASALLERFLSSDACSDSLATDYVANVAQALQDSISRRAGRPEHNKHGHFPTSEDWLSRSSTQLADVKQSTLVAGNLGPSSLSAAAEDVGQDAVVPVEVGSAMPGAEGAFKRHKKRRRHSVVENGLETVPPSASEMEDSAYMHHSRKRRKKEKHERETEGYGFDGKKQHDREKRKEEQEIEAENVVTEYPAPYSLNGSKRRKEEKQGRYTEGMEFADNKVSLVSLLVDENLEKKSAHKAKRKVEVANDDEVSVMYLSSKLEPQAGSSKRNSKEDHSFLSTTPSKVTLFEKNREETASPRGFESLASEEEKKSKKKKRRKEELSGLVRQSLSG